MWIIKNIDGVLTPVKKQDHNFHSWAVVMLFSTRGLAFRYILEHMKGNEHA